MCTTKQMWLIALSQGWNAWEDRLGEIYMYFEAQNL